MTPHELAAVRRELETAYRSWHGCELSAIDAKRMQLPVGRLCDMCLEEVEAAITRLTVSAGEQHGKP